MLPLPGVPLAAGWCEGAAGPAGQPVRSSGGGEGPGMVPGTGGHATKGESRSLRGVAERRTTAASQQCVTESTTLQTDMWVRQTQVASLQKVTGVGEVLTYL